MEREELLKKLYERFHDNMDRHPETIWDEIEPNLTDQMIEQLTWMEETEGEPDVVYLPQSQKTIYVDMSPETPKGRVSLCYDKEARLGRKKFPPESSVIEETSSRDLELVDEDIYHQLQSIEPLDRKTSSWLLTPSTIRDLGGAIFGDCRYEHVFIYHNGADSYYGSRAFRTYFEL